MAVILIVDDEPDIRELIEYNLKTEGYDVRQAENGIKALAELKADQGIDLMVLDLMMPEMDGLSVCRKIKRGEEGLPDIPIIILTAKGEEADIIAGLETGADDYMIKPFSPKVLVAKIKAVLRRSRAETGMNGELIRFDKLVIDLKAREIKIKNRPVSFTLSEFNLLFALASRPHQVFTRTQLLDKIGGPDSFVIERNVDVHIASLRKKLGTAGSLVRTVRGIGYKFIPGREQC
ncbi:MAG: response regulator [bacterium]